MDKWYKIKEMIDQEIEDVVRGGKLNKDIVTSLVMMYDLCEKLSGRSSYGHEQTSRDGYSNEQWGNSRDEMRHHLERAYQAAGSNAEREEISRMMRR